MATKAKHLAALMAQRTEWTEADRLLADQLAALRSKLDAERKAAANAPMTVSTAAGGEKPNPLFAGIERMSKQEAQLSRRLGLGAQRNARGRSEAAKSPMEARKQLWNRFGKAYAGSLLPGAWRCLVQQHSVEIPEDFVGWPSNPRTLPMPKGI